MKISITKFSRNEDKKKERKKEGKKKILSDIDTDDKQVIIKGWFQYFHI